MFLPTLEAEPVFSGEHSSCESCWSVGVGARKASKIVSDLVKGRAPSRPQIGVTMMGDRRRSRNTADTFAITRE